ncbi:MAG: cytochrome c3 family protein [Chloroflexota bacterium]
MTHLKRAGALLVVVVLAAFVVPRIIPVPDDLISFGFHKADKAANEQFWAGQPMQYANPTVCNDCHQDKSSSWAQGDHRTVSCETCHSPANDHIAGKGLPVVDTSRDFCGTCHSSLISRPANFPQIDIEEHGGQNECITCHNPHDPREGMPPRLPHSMEGRENCQSCHNPSEPLVTVPPRVPHTLVGRENCTSCHGTTEARPAALPRIPHTLEGRDNCLLCHNTSAIKPFPENHTGRTTDTCRNCHQPEG